MSSRRTRNLKSSVKSESIFKFTYPVNEINGNQGRKRHCQNASNAYPEKSSRNQTNSVTFSSPQPEMLRRSARQPSSARPQVPASPSFNHPDFDAFKQSTPMHKNERSERKRASPMKKATMYRTPEKKKRIYSSDEEELEFSPSGRRMPIAERRELLQTSKDWGSRVEQEDRFHGVYVKSVERLKKKLLSESLQSCDTSTTGSEISESSLDLSNYEVDEAVLTRRQKQIAYGKNTAEYEYYARRVDKISRNRKDPQTPDKFDRVSRRRFDGRIRTWRVHIHRWFETNSSSEQVAAAPIVNDENTVTAQGPSEDTMTGVPRKQMQSSPIRATTRANIPGYDDESAVDAFASPKKPATTKTGEVHSELTCDLAGFGISTDSQSTLTGPPAPNCYQTRSRARLVFS